MIAFIIGGVSVRIHISFIVMASLAALLGGHQEIAVAAVSLAAHEAGHALAARVSKAKITEIELMPFGAAARIEDMYGLSAIKAVFIALAGPAASLALCAASRLFAGAAADLIWGVNASIAAFNLLPALPLDGGRALSRLLGCRLSARKAVAICVNIGRAAALALIAAAVTVYMATGVINATYVMSAVYILMSGKREKLAAGGGILLSMLDRKKNISDEGVMPVKWLATTQGAKLETLLGRFSQGSVHRIAVYDDSMRLVGVIEEDDILKLALGTKPSTVGEILA